ncbi:formin frm3, partial [Cystoisospora suis]
MSAAKKMKAWVLSREDRLSDLKENVKKIEEMQNPLRNLMGLSPAECQWPEPLRWFSHFYTQFDLTAKEYREAK